MENMKIILNERKKAEEYLKNKDIDNVVQCISILAKYFQTPLITDDEIYILIDNFLRKSFIGYKPENWKKMIYFQIKKSKNQKLTEIDSIPVSSNEIAKIKTLENNRLEKLAFTLLIVAKYYNIINPNNNNWTNKNLKTIFSLANVSVTKDKQCNLLNTLKEKGFITLSKKVDSLNFNVEYIEENIKSISYSVTDMIDLGNQWLLNFRLNNTYKKCGNCNKIIKVSKNKKYCKNCSFEAKKVNQKEWIKNKRKNKSIN